MKRLLVAFCALFIATGALADGVFVAPAPPGQIPGTATNDSASAGNVGEFKASAILSSFTFTATITIASPAVISGTHNYTGIAPIVFSTTGALPTGITSGTTYFTSPSTVANGSFNIATTVDNAVAGTFVNTSGTQSGVQTGAVFFPATTGTGYDTCALSLTAGDWDISFLVEYTPANTTTVTPATQAGISPTSTTISAANWPTGVQVRAGVFTGNGSPTSLVPPPFRASLSATTTYYGVFRPTFGTSTLTFVGCVMTARRRR